MTISEFIEKYEPCREAKIWLLTQPDLQSAWNTCTCSDWMLWALKKAGISEQQNAQLAAEFVYQTPLSDGRVVADLLTDQRSIDFLQLKKAWGDAEPGAPRPEQWEAAGEAAWSSAEAAGEAAWSSAEAAGEAAWSSAKAAEAAAWAAAGEAAETAWEAKTSAWETAWKTARETRAARAARAAAEEKQCDIIRLVFPVCPF